MPLPTSDSNRILLITDQVKLLYSELLSSAGFDVDAVRSIPQARQSMVSNTYGLILVAVSDNAEEALKFCEETKETMPHAKVALITSWHVYVPRTECPDDVIRKDYNPQNFLSSVSELLPSA